jgi:hypothetical protein
MIYLAGFLDELFHQSLLFLVFPVLHTKTGLSVAINNCGMDNKCTMLLFLPRILALLPRLLVPAIVGVLAAAILYPVFNVDAVLSKVELSPVVSTTITVREPCDGPVIEPELVVKDQAGNVIKQTTVGTQVLIEGSVFLDCIQYPDDSQTTIFEVRDEEGITTYFAWQIILEDSKQIVTGVSWTPDAPGKYEVRFFPIVCLICPMVLSKVVEYEIIVV